MCRTLSTAALVLHAAGGAGGEVFGGATAAAACSHAAAPADLAQGVLLALLRNKGDAGKGERVAETGCERSAGRDDEMAGVRVHQRDTMALGRQQCGCCTQQHIQTQLAHTRAITATAVLPESEG